MREKELSTQASSLESDESEQFSLFVSSVVIPTHIG
jgi:hypothetical protein